MLHNTTFDYLKPSVEQSVAMAKVRNAYAELHAILSVYVPEGRYGSLALSALEQSAMWANKGITRESDGSPRPGALT